MLVQNINHLPVECLVNIMQELPVTDRKNTYLVSQNFQIATLLATIDISRKRLSLLHSEIKEYFPHRIRLLLAINQCKITLAVRYTINESIDKQVIKTSVLIAERQRLLNSQEASMQELTTHMRVSNDKILALMRNTRI